MKQESVTRPSAAGRTELLSRLAGLLALAALAAGCGGDDEGILGRGSEHMKLNADVPATLDDPGKAGSAPPANSTFAELDELSRRRQHGDPAPPPPPADIEIIDFDDVVKMAQEAEQAGDMERARQYYLAAQNLVADSGPEEWRRAGIMRTLGFFYQMKYGNSQLAIEAFEEYIRLQEIAHGPNSNQVADALIDLTGIYNQMGRKESSLALYERAAAIREKNDGPDSRSLAQILGWWADILRQLGREGEARPLFDRHKRILADLEKTQ